MLPLATREKHIPLHVEVAPAESGLKPRPFVKCEDMRSISRERLIQRRGSVSKQKLAAVEERVRMLLGL